MATNNTTFLDSSTNALTVTKTGNVGQGTLTPFAPTWSTMLSANGDYINATAADSAIGFLANNLTTVEAWVFPTANASTSSWTSCIIGNDSTVGAQSRWGLLTVANAAVNADASVVFWYTGPTAAGTQVATTAYGVKFGKWNHIAMTVDASTPASSIVTIYVNGVGQTFSTDLSGHTVLTSGYRIGGGYWSTRLGHISNFRIVKGRLVYAADFTPPTSPLLPIDGTVLLTCCTPTLSDESLYASALVPSTTTVLASELSPFPAGSDVPYSPSTSIYFPANGSYLYKAAPGNGDFDPGATGAWTLETWVMPLSSTTTYLMAFGNSAAFGNSLLLKYEASKFAVTQSNGTSAVVTITPATTSALNTWHHVAVSKDASNVIRLFVNGVQVGTQTSSAPLVTGCGAVLNGALDSAGTGNGGGNFYLSNVHWVKGTCLYSANFLPDASPTSAVTNTKLLINGNTLVDSSSSNYTFTLAGTVPPAVRKLCPHYMGVPTTRSIYFPANGSYLYKAAPGNGDFDPGATGAWTFECWFLPKAASLMEIATMGLLVQYGNAFELQYLANKTLAFYQGSGSGIVVSMSSGSVTCSLNAWHHIAISKDATNVLRMFLDGKLVTSTTNSSSLTTGNAFLLNGGFGSGGLGNTGGKAYISNVRWVKGTCLYTAAFTPSTTPLTAVTNTKLLLTDSLTDRSANAYTMTTSGSTALDSKSPFVSAPSTAIAYDYRAATFGGSASFDGVTGNYLSTAASATLAVGSSDFTLETWVYPLNVVSTGRISGLLASGGAMPDVSWYVSGGSVYAGASSNNTSFNISSGAISTIASGQWTHLAVCRSGNSMYWYVNGALKLTSNVTGVSFHANCAMFVGWDGCSNDASRFRGHISGYNFVKSALYKTPFLPPTAPPSVAAIPALLLNFSNIGVWDASKCSDWQTLGTAATQATIFKSGTGSLSFNGTSDYLMSDVSGPYNQMSGRAFTVEFWMFPTAWAAGTTNNEYRSIIGASAIAPAQGWRIMLGTSAQGAVFFSANGAAYTGANAAQVSLNAWTHLAFVYDGANLSVYKNGIRVSGPTALTWTNTADTLRIGAFASGALGYYYQGYLDTIQVSYGAKYAADFTADDTSVAFDKTTYKVTRPGTQMLISGEGNTSTTNANVIDRTANAVATRSGSGTLTTPTTFSPFGDRWSMFMDKASGSGLSFPSSANWNLSAAQGDFTLEFWYKPYYNPTTGSGVFLMGTVNLAYAPGSNGWCLWHDDAAHLGFGSNGSATLVNCAWNLGAWQHIAICRNGTQVRVFFDGAVCAVIDSSAFTNGTGTLYIGCDNTYTTRNANGCISNVRLVRGTALYTSAFTVPTSRLTTVSGTALLTCQDSRPVDNSTNRAVATVLGTPKVVKDSPFLPGSALNGSLCFSGVASNYLGVASNAVFGMSTGDYTVEMWFYPFAFTAANLLSRADGNGDFTLDSTGLLKYVYTGTSALQCNPSLNTWNHIAVCRASGTLRLFLNGVLVQSVANSTSTSATAMTIGATASGTSVFNGHISNLHIVKGTALYTSAFTPARKPVTAVSGTKLLTGQVYGAVDKSPNALTLTPTGSVTYSDASPFFQEVYANSVSLTSAQQVTTSTAISTAPGTGDFTVEGWFYSTAAWSNTTLVGTSTNNAFFVYVQTPTVIGIGQKTVASLTVNPGYSLSAGTWYHMAVSRKSGTCAMFINGKRVWSQAWSASIVAGDVAIGGGLTGYAANVRFVVGTAMYDPAAPNILVPNSHLTAVSGTQLLTLQDNGIVDSSTNKMTLSANGGLTSTFSPFTPGSAWFSGSAYTTFPSINNYDLGSGDFTIEGWIYPTGNTTGRYYTWLCKVAGTAGPFYVTQYNGALFPQVSGTNASWSVPLGVAADKKFGVLNINAWNHFALVRNGSTIQTYLNGVPGDSATVSGALYSNTTALSVGGDASGIEFAAGYASNFRIVKGAALYRAAFVPPYSQNFCIANEVVNLPMSDVSFSDSANGFALVPSGATVKPSTAVAAKSGASSLYFDGASSVSMPSADFCYDGDFTIEWWQYQLTPTSTYPAAFCIDAYAAAPDNYHMKMYVNVGGSGHSLNVANATLTGWAVSFSLGTVPSLNAWHHYAVTRSGSTWRVFIDGVQVGTATYAGTVVRPAAGTLALGYSGSATSYFKGYIDNFKITIGESLYNTTFTPTY